ncbi:hypothetical protein [Bifidobacterium imperatoris]|uniref:hypothetical protein n=1 Tax=Bifidobacterium imperatoris TaxID=2020965 RepID=UPI001F61B54B|nr:hypothetical protein [Bifidobacterium imperatoris]
MTWEVTPWLRLVVTTISQTLYLEGVDIPGKPDTESARIFWHPWVANRMGRRQVALHKAAIAYRHRLRGGQGGRIRGWRHACCHRMLVAA